ncbi:MAG: ABC transporter permease subunit [Candidatus Pacebacteria bacterium]|nr:ABC transporter permease subunit [Candidatus Paceibacterota bacterium]
METKKIRIPLFFGMHAEPGQLLSICAGALPFIILIAGYLYLSHERNLSNPDEKLMPTPAKIVTAFNQVAFKADVKTGDTIFWHDTGVSLRRLGYAAIISSVLALWFGMNLALFKGMNALCMPLLRFSSLVPPPILLPVLFLTVGVEEASKVVIIVISIAPAMTLAVYGTVSKMAGEQITRSFTLGATQLDVIYRILLPQVLPRLIEILRTSLGMAWYSLILAEAIAASSGIGYRIYLVRRFTQMDVIIPYALWVVVLGYAMNYILGLILDKCYPWYSKQKEN